MNHSKLVIALAASASLLAACGGGSSNSPVPPAATTQSQSVGAGASAMSHVLTDRTGAIIPGAHIMGVRSPFGGAHDFSTFAGANLAYHGGPVQVQFHTVVVYWGFTTDPSGEEARLNAFLSGLGGSSWISTDNQYYEKVSGKTIYIKNPTGNFVGSWVDTTDAIPSSPTDAQIAAEAARAKTHFGITGLKYNIIVATAHGHSTSGFGTQWCAYHSNSGNLVYTNLPYMTDAGTSCGENSVNSGSAGLLDGVTIVAGHEIAEAQTDPKPASGWVDSSGQENGDKCAWTNLQNTSFSTGTFPTQPIWSNKVSGCVQ